MASPIYKFNYPNCTEDFYFIFDTITGFPFTIPMDLATLIQFHFETNRSLLGLIELFPKILADGTSLENSTFEEDFTGKWLSHIYENTLYSGTIETAILNHDLSASIHTKLLDNKNLIEKLNQFDFYEDRLDFLQNYLLTSAPINYKCFELDIHQNPYSYYRAGGSDLQKWIDETLNEKSNIFTDYNEKDFIDFYINFDFKLHLLPFITAISTIY